MVEFPFISTCQWRFQPSDLKSDYELDGDSTVTDPGRAPGDETDDPFRAEIDPDAAHALLLALTRAVRCMPALWRMTFALEPPISCGNHIELMYMVEGGILLGDDSGGGTAELSIECRSMFRPDDKVLQIWREAVQENTRAGLVVVLRDTEGEILANIISYFAAECNRHDGSDRFFHFNQDNDCFALAPYAAVSREWQQRIEAVTFVHIILTPARLALPLAAQALTPDRVRRFVRSIRVHVLLPPYDKQARARCEDEADRAANDSVFTNVVRRLFALLAGGQDGGQQQQRAGDDAGYRPKICLSITASCVSNAEDMEARRDQWDIYGRLDTDIYEARYESSYLDLRPAAGKSVQDEAEALPQLHCINQFRVFATASRAADVYTLPGDVLLHEPYFAYALQTLPSSLRHFNLDYHRVVPLDHSFQTPSILEETDRDDNDKLSLALQKLSQRLVSFTLMADVGPEAVWPGERAQDDDPLWPRMRNYFINPGAIAPSGQWRYLRSNSDDSDDDGQDMLSNYADPFAAPGDETEEHLRDNPDPDAVRALLLATARAVCRMPVLWDMCFVLGPIGEGQLEVEYAAKAGKAKLTVHSHPLFQPDEEIVRLCDLVIAHRS
ncbi:hypothetical protein C8A05DRAFT_38121 [Staphylotrichum tortipilum]|uniref:Uncharacterized protein n=1 Tax=Staphylotrichum tortipilum TaxID=2831512 RepID=A0AAN6RQ28_9PEZI|nr:hypothetical protein C8A05DRAFT_38121 [Staphylotrichum longicolle]